MIYEIIVGGLIGLTIAVGATAIYLNFSCLREHLKEEKKRGDKA